MREAKENIERNGTPETGAAEEKPYVLPPWRMSQILLEVLSVLDEEEYYEDGFDYKKMIRGKGIKLKGFSSFAPKNLAEFRGISISLWTEGLCLVFPDEDTGKTCRMIAYNDSLTAGETMQIILHEFAHIRLGHTEQSVNGEVEATCFAITMSLMLLLEERFHIGKALAQRGGRNAFLQGIKSAMERKEVV